MASRCPARTELRPPTPPLDVPSSAGGEDRVQQNERSLQIADCDQQHLGQSKGSCLRPRNLRSGKSVGGIANQHAPNARHAATSAFGDPRAGRRLRRLAPSVCRSAATTTALAKLLAHPGMGPIRDIVVRVARSFHDGSTPGGERRTEKRAQNRKTEPENRSAQGTTLAVLPHMPSHTLARARYSTGLLARVSAGMADGLPRTNVAGSRPPRTSPPISPPSTRLPPFSPPRRASSPTRSIIWMCAPACSTSSSLQVAGAPSAARPPAASI